MDADQSESDYSVNCEAEKTTTCPYNKAHVVLNFRFTKHLVKCRKSYDGIEMETCPFNVSHVVPKPEIFYHKKTCVDRFLVLNYLKAQQKEPEEQKEEDSDWDDEIGNKQDEETSAESMINQSFPTSVRIAENEEVIGQIDDDWMDNHKPTNNQLSDLNEATESPQKPIEEASDSDWSDDDQQFTTFSYHEPILTQSLSCQAEINRYSDYLRIKPSLNVSSQNSYKHPARKPQYPIDETISIENGSAELSDWSFYSGRKSDDEILSRFNELCQNKNYELCDTWHDRMYREMVKKN